MPKVREPPIKPSRVNTREEELLSALLWLRNQYAAATDDTLRSHKVLDVIYKVLCSSPTDKTITAVSGEVFASFRYKYLYGETF